MVSKVVFDSSAILAYLQRETGWEDVEPYLQSESIISSVNLAEVVGKLHEKGVADGDIKQVLDSLALVVVPFDEAQALKAGELRPVNKSLGLSLGDRACLALTLVHTLPVMTTDRAWQKLKIGVHVMVVR